MELKRFLNRVTLVLLLLVIWAGWQVWSPRSLSQYSGYDASPMPLDESTQYIAKIQERLKRGEVVKLTEESLNRFLKGALKVEQSYAVRPWVGVKGVFIDLRDAGYSLCLERDVYGREHHLELSCALTMTQPSASRLKTSVKYFSGMLGKLKLPAPLVYNISPWVKNFHEVLEPIYLELKPYIGSVELKKGVLIIHPPKHV